MSIHITSFTLHYLILNLARSPCRSEVVIVIINFHNRWNWFIC